jgi:predicted class III extradiol MEMO1 family dioxygenase
VISSDFCHWGGHFDYQPFDGKGEIWQYIKNLDHEGMKHIEKQDLAGFKAYLG